ncbi:uncharacterized protein K441DRAFT_430711, partial [Cenococcum geophilum 1.58]|uniref:uncharacterized protein n=1 Tax=Cenococcum geophilum 1.58 TaxID=794803 RepID=UPI0035900803
LWDRAYDELKDKESKESELMDAYEKVMAHILKKGDLSPTAPEPDENEIETDLAARRLQMNKLVDDGLKKTEKLANVMKGIGGAIQVIDSVKETIGKGIESVPCAGIAWAGVCIALQILKAPADETTTNRDGIVYVCERMEWYWNLSNIQFEENVVDIRSLVGLRDRLEKHIIDLYKALLLYQIKSVLSYYRNQGFDFLRNLFKSDDWDGSLKSVRDAEDIFRQDLAVYN